MLLKKVLDPLIIDKDTLQDIFELRLVPEMGLADLLYIRKTEKDINELEEIARSQASNKAQPFRIKNEIEFHGKLYEMTGNDTLKRFQNMLLPIFGYVVTLEKSPSLSNISHLDLVQILKTGDKEDFRKAMQEHLQPHFNRLK